MMFFFLSQPIRPPYFLDLVEAIGQNEQLQILLVLKELTANPGNG